MTTMQFNALLFAASRIVHPIVGLREMYRRGRFIAVAYKHRDLINSWLDVGDMGGLASSLLKRPQMIGIVEWPYLHKEWDISRRFETILTHYTELETLPWLRIEINDARVLSDLTELMPGLRIVLDRPVWFQREGELTLNLFIHDTRVYSLAFILGRESGQRTATVGAMQGRNLENIESVYRDITKRLFGSRPRDFLSTVFQLLAIAAGAERIIAVSEECRHHRHRYFGVKAGETNSAKYDDIWSDRGGIPISDGFFELPLRPTVRSDSDIPSHKRSMYRKRYSLFDRIQTDIANFVNQHPQHRSSSYHQETQHIELRPTAYDPQPT